MIITAEKAREITKNNQAHTEIMGLIEQAALNGNTSIKTTIKFYHDYFISLGYTIIPARGRHNVPAFVITWDPVACE